MGRRLSRRGAVARRRQAAPSGTILWTGDAENPTNQDWATIFTKDPFCNATPQDGIAPNNHGGYHTRVTSNPTPMQGAYCYKGMVDDTIVCSQERTELSQLGSNNPKQFHPGDETWEAFGIWLGPDFQINRSSAGASTLYQHKPIPSDNPTSSLKVETGVWKWTAQGGDPLAPVKSTITIGAAAAGIWYRFLIHTIYASDNTGLAELWSDVAGGGNGILSSVASYQRPSLYTNTTGIRVNMGLYRDSSDTGVETFAHDGYAAGTTRQIVTAHAFGVAS